MADVLSASAATDPEAKRRRTTVGSAPTEPLEHMRTETLHLAAANGILLGADGPFSHAPCSLLPYAFPASLFSQAESLATPFNTLVDRVARDTDWLCKTVRSVVEHDEFTRRLLELCEEVVAEGVVQPLQLGIYRSDYMVDQPTEDAAPRILQVELNTVSVSFPSLSAKMTRMHRQSVARWGSPTDRIMAPYLAKLPACAAALTDDTRLPLNASESGVAAALALAHREYIAQRDAGKRGAEGAAPPTAVLMVVQPTERNVIDQRGIEHALWREHAVPLVRMPLKQVLASGVLDGPQRRLRVDGVEVSVVYFRAGYTPNDFPSEAEWSARTLIERSMAIKCPSVAQHLAGTKKVQQVLAQPAQLARFASDEQAAVLRSCFAGLYGLDEDGGEAVEAIVRKARAAPDDFVLKPQREGGGNNLYGEELRAALGAMSPAERASFILMERIRPPTSSVPLMRDGELDGGPCTCELGVYGVFLGDGRRVLLNQPAGHLLRVKLDGVNEGGVCAGFAVLSSPVLYP